MRTLVSTMLLCAVAALSTRSRRGTGGRTTVKMEDFGLMKGTPFGFTTIWGNGQELSETKLEYYLNEHGLRYRMDKTEKEQYEEARRDLFEMLGLTSTSNNAARQKEKKKAIKEAGMLHDSAIITPNGAGATFYNDQLSTNDEELKKTGSGFRMRKARGVFLDLFLGSTDCGHRKTLKGTNTRTPHRQRGRVSKRHQRQAQVKHW